MVRHGCSLLLALAALAAVSSAPASGPTSGPQPHPPSSSLPLSEQAARLGFTLPPRQPLKATRAALTATGAQSYPFGMADPQPPPRSRQRKPAVASRIRRDADDIYDETRLPTNVVPSSYTVSMQPDLQSGTFYGATDIYIDVVEATSRIILHGGPDIRFREVQIWKAAADGTWADNGKASFVPLSRNEDLERLVIDLEKGLEVGQKYLLRFPLFLAYLRDDLKGFYLSTYKDNNGRTVRLATTQFEPPAARFAFPCFDEPALKAKFKIIVYHDPALGVRSNMPGKTEPATLLVMRTTFEETPIMSTYLLAWVVSDFASLPASTGGVTTWGRKNLLNEDTAYLANMVAPLALQRLADFNGVPYTMPKTDQFSIPDFDAGAMENWGIVTYREEYLMETEATTIRIREFIGTTVCHELGHAWTGDLVTLDWWSNTWLNEGFATYFENVICDTIFPDWKLMDMYVTDNVHVGIANDVLPGQIAMSSPVHGTGGIEAKFDRISYKKGGSVLRMFEHLIGTEVFKKAMKRYLTENELKNGTPDKLFSAMDAEAKLANAPLPANTDFPTMAKTWTEQAGVPVLTVTRNTGKSTVTITQEQFFYETPEDQVKTLWYVPIPAIADPSTSTTDLTWTAPFNWLTPNTPSLDVAVTAKDTEWILVNPQQIGYYLVNYDEANWKLLQSALVASPTAFPASTRTQLVHDALAMARAGRLDYAVALPFLQALKAERSPATWKAGIEALAFLRDRLSLTEAGQALRVFINQITADAYKSVGFGPGAVAPQKDTSKDQERYLRYFVASYACYGGNKQCIDDAVKAIENINLNFDSPNADVKDAALCYAAQNSATVSDSIVNSYLLADGTQDRAQFAAAVSCTQDHTILAKLMDGIMARQDGTDLNAADLEQLINAVLSRWENHRFMLNYYKKNWKKIGLFTQDTFYVSILDSLIDDIRTEEELNEVRAFVAEAFPQVESAVRQEFELHLAAAEKDLDWSKKYFKTVSQWLYTTTGTGPVAPPTEPPTEAPTKAPTEPWAPTKAPTGGPTNPPPKPPAPTPSSTPASAADQVTAVATIVIASLLAFMVR